MKPIVKTLSSKSDTKEPKLLPEHSHEQRYLSGDDALQNMLRQSVIASLFHDEPPAHTVFTPVAVVLEDTHDQFHGTAFSGEDFGEALDCLQQYGVTMTNQYAEIQLTAMGLNLARQLEEARVKRQVEANNRT